MLLNIKNIKTDKDLEEALQRIDKIIDAKPGSPERDELEILSVLVRDYEEKHYPVSLPDPIEAIKIRMEDLHLQPKNLEDIIGGKTAVSFILNRQRVLSKSMIRGLHDKLNIPYEVLFQDYKIIIPKEKQPKKKYPIQRLRAANKSIKVKEPQAAKSKKVKQVKKRKA